MPNDIRFNGLFMKICALIIYWMMLIMLKDVDEDDLI